MKRILVIERDAKIRDLLTRFLGVKGYDVTATVDGASGMDRFIGERPDLILVDLQLPDMDGIDLCRAIRDTRLDVALVLMGTARQARKPHIEAARDALSIPLFLIKPFGVDALLAAIEQGLAGGPPTSVATPTPAPAPETPPPTGLVAVPIADPPEVAAAPTPPAPAPAVQTPAPAPVESPVTHTPPAPIPALAASEPAAPEARDGAVPKMGIRLPASRPSLPAIEAVRPPTLETIAGVPSPPAPDGADADGPATLEELIALRDSGGMAAIEPRRPLTAVEAIDDEGPAASYGASSAGGLLSRGSMEFVSPPLDDADESPPDMTASRLEAVYAVETAENHTWGLESLRMEAIRHGPHMLADDEQRYALQPIVPQSPSDPRGIYDAITVPNLLYRCFLDLFTGRLIIRRGPVRKVITLANGRPLAAESNIRSESLGYLLQQEGVIDQKQLEHSGRMARQMSMRQGEALVRMGAIDADELADALRRQLRLRILSCFAWSGAEYGLTYEPDVRAQLDAIELNPLVLIFDGIKTSFPIAPLVAHFDTRNRSPVSVTARLRDYATMLRQFADELRVSTLCDGQRTLGEVIARSPYGLVDSLRILRALEITGCLTFGEQQPVGDFERPTSPRAAVGGSLDGSLSGSHSVPGSIGGRSFSGRRPPRRPPNVAAPYSRATVDVPAGGSVGGSVDGSVDGGESAADRRRAMRNRRDAARRTETGPDLIKADANFAKGRRCLEEEDLQNALAHFQLACKQDPPQQLFKMYRGWVRFLLAPAHDRQARAQAHDEIKAALDADSNQDEGYVLLGNVYRTLGKDEQAMKLYRKALSLNRRNPAANRAIREMEGRRTLEERDPQGLFGKFFTRR